MEKLIQAQFGKNLDLTKKEDWNMHNAKYIAANLGFVYSERFIQILENFIEINVKKATVTSLLTCVATNVFNKVEPPLEKIK